MFRCRIVFILSAFGFVALGCDAPKARYRLHMAYALKMEKANLSKDDSGYQKRLSNRQLQDVADVLAAMFGSPDQPKLPPVEGIDKVVDGSLLALSAGPVGSDENGRARGLYREHCVHCHGITGDGAGPTAAFLNPYPRDYRKGVYKFKSTPTGQKPTDEDLHRVLYNGIAGTAMPSFKLLKEQEVESLIHYVKYLSVRGEVERQLLAFATEEVDEGARVFDPSAENAKERLDTFKGFVQEIAAKWAESQPTEVPAPPNGLDSPESIARGKQLYYGAVANCFSCHGNSALGDGQQDFYDAWAEEWIPKGQPASVAAEYVAMGALQPRNLIPRNLRFGVYRGGRRPVDMYWRIVNGIEGAQMPAAPPDKLKPEDVWDIVSYVRSLPYESINYSRRLEPSVDRAIN